MVLEAGVPILRKGLTSKTRFKIADNLSFLLNRLKKNMIAQLKILCDSSSLSKMQHWLMYKHSNTLLEQSLQQSDPSSIEELKVVKALNGIEKMAKLQVTLKPITPGGYLESGHSAVCENYGGL